MERILILVKPDGVQRGLSGEVIKRFEQKGFKMTGCKLMQVSQEQAEKHYAEHREKPFFGELVSFITSGPVLAMVWEGDNIISIGRMMIGKTNPAEAQPGTIRGDFAVHIDKNVIHGSDSPENAEREISIFFKPEEIVAYDKVISQWI